MHRFPHIGTPRAVGLAAAALGCALVFSAGVARPTFAGTTATPTDTPTATPEAPPPTDPDTIPPSGSAPPAARYYGAVTEQGNPGNTGDNVTAMASDGSTCGSVNIGDPPASGSNYALDDTGSDPDCSTPGSEITFMVNGSSATPSTDPSVPDVSGAVHVDISVP